MTLTYVPVGILLLAVVLIVICHIFFVIAHDRALATSQDPQTFQPLQKGRRLTGYIRWLIIHIWEENTVRHGMLLPHTPRLDLHPLIHSDFYLVL